MPHAPDAALRPPVRRWEPVELELTADGDAPADGAACYAAEVDVTFRHDSGATLVRPAFWDGGAAWRARFASPLDAGTWRWSVAGGPASLARHSGAVDVEDAGPPSTHAGPLRMAPDGRSVVRADGSPWLMVADTPWALPFRATVEQVEDYAALRQAQGFNAALLMTVQPDRAAAGPRDRSAAGGFDVAFDDLPDGRLTKLRPEYFRALDRLIAALRRHGIAPVLQPVFHGYGWRGGGTAGKVVPPGDYARYCRYLVARYGAEAALYLVCGDGTGREPNVAAGGEAVEACDAYRQPTGLHYGPNRLPNAHQSAAWLDFQWCQTGHAGLHAPERVMWMWCQSPPRAVANGEPTYETPTVGAGEWQLREAWRNLCAGGTMGVAYGANSLWQWKLAPDEPGHADWCSTAAHGWREAMAQPGAAYVGNVGRILGRYDTAGLAPDWTPSLGLPGLCRAGDPGGLRVAYAESGGVVTLWRDDFPPDFRAYDCRTAAVVAAGTVDRSGDFPHAVRLPDGPHALVFADRHPADREPRP